MGKIKELEREYYKIISKYEDLEKSVDRINEVNKTNKNNLWTFSDAKEIISSSIFEVQSNFKSIIENTVNEVISFIWENKNYSFTLEAKEKSGGFEWEPKVFEGENEIEDLKTDSGGLLSVIGFVFKIVFHIMSKDNLMNTLIFDEPVSNLGELTGKFAEIIEYLSNKFGIQFIIVTHNEELKSMNAKVFKVKHNGVHSFIE